MRAASLSSIREFVHVNLFPIAMCSRDGDRDIRITCKNKWQVWITRNGELATAYQSELNWLDLFNDDR